MTNNFKSFLKNKLTQDIGWNMLSLLMIFFFGMLIQVLIAWFYTPDTLGVFNQVLAVYMLFSQFSVFGIHHSVLKHTSENSDTHFNASILFAGLSLSVLTSFIFALILFLTANNIAKLFSSNQVSQGLLYVVPGVIFFSFNKILLSSLNGLREMKLFALFNTSRYLFMVTALILRIIFEFNNIPVSAILTFAEILMFPFVIISVLKIIKPVNLDRISLFLKTHLVFGSKSFLSGVIYQLNTKIDIIMLGIFVTDSLVGVYSFAAIIVRGIFQTLTIFRVNFNPVTIKILNTENVQKFYSFFHSARKKVYQIMIPFGLFSIALYPLILKLLTNKSVFIDSWLPFTILIFGIMLCSGYLPFNQLLLLTGHPGKHTLLVVLTFTFNIVGNWLLIPPMGINGAALATSLAFPFSLMLLSIILKKYTSVSLFRSQRDDRP